METLKQLKLRFIAFTEGRSTAPMTPEGTEWLLRVAEAARKQVYQCNCRATIKPECGKCKKLRELFE